MKVIGVMSIGAMLVAAAANAQTLPRDGAVAPYLAVSDVGGPNAAMPPETFAPEALAPEALPPRYYAPEVLPPQAIYGVLRANGYSPLGGLQQRGLVYTIAVLDLDGDDGRLVIDARSGRILRFMPAYRMGAAMDDETMASYGPPGALPPLRDLRRPPRPPLPVPRVASRSSAVPLPKATPPRAVIAPKADTPVAAQPAPAPSQQSAAVEPKPAAPPTVQAKPPVVLQPTQDMPPAQGLE